MYVLMCRTDSTNYHVDDITDHVYPISCHVTHEHAKHQMGFNKSYLKIPLDQMWIVEVECPDF